MSWGRKVIAIGVGGNLQKVRVPPARMSHPLPSLQLSFAREVGSKGGREIYGHGSRFFGKRKELRREISAVKEGLYSQKCGKGETCKKRSSVRSGGSCEKIKGLS